MFNNKGDFTRHLQNFTWTFSSDECYLQLYIYLPESKHENFFFEITGRHLYKYYDYLNNYINNMIINA